MHFLNNICIAVGHLVCIFYVQNEIDSYHLYALFCGIRNLCGHFYVLLNCIRIAAGHLVCIFTCDSDSCGTSCIHFYVEFETLLADKGIYKTRPAYASERNRLLLNVYAVG